MRKFFLACILILSVNSFANEVDTGIRAAENGDFATAFSNFDKTCKQGNLDGCYNLALLYSAGQGVMKDIRKAEQLFADGCNKGDAKSCNNLGYMYDHAKDGITQDYPKAFKLYKKSCDNKDMAGCANLGAMYHYGKSVKINLAKAETLYKLSCKEFGFGCFNYGLMYFKKGNSKTAVEYFAKACEKNHSGGCLSLGAMYIKGDGVEKNLNTAKSLFSKACDLKNEKGCEGVRILSR